MGADCDMISGVKKELMFFMRGARFAAFVIVIVSLALSSPLMFGFMKSFMDVMNSTDMPEEYLASFSMFTDVNAAFMCAMSTEYVAGIGSIVMLFIFMGTAGGEQIKRSVIIPQCAGLKPTQYILPKFAVYPPVVFIVSALSMYLCAGLSLAIFGGTIDPGYLTLSALTLGLYMAFLCILQFTIGLSTGKPKTALVAVIIAEMFLPSMLSYFRVDKFNPMALYSISENAGLAAGGAEEIDSGSIMNLVTVSLQSADLSAMNVIVSSATAVILSVLMVILTVYVLSIRQVHNEGNEPLL